MKKLLSCISIALVVGSCLIISTVIRPVSAAGKEPIKMAIISDFTGPYGLWATMDNNGIRLAVEEINRKGGLLGREVELFKKDSKLNPALAGSLARDAIERGGAEFLFGAISSAVTLGTSSVCKEYKKILMVNTSSNENIIYQQGHPYVFMGATNGIMAGRSLGMAVNRAGAKKIVTVAADYVTGHDFVKRMKEGLEIIKSDANVVKKFWTKPGEKDFGPHISAIMATDADFVMAMLWGSDQLTFIKQAKPLGLFDKFKVGITVVTSDVLEGLGREMPEGVLCQHRAPFWGLSGARADSFVSDFRKRFGSYPNEYAVLGYVDTCLLLEAIKVAGTTDADAVSSKLEQIRFDTVLGEQMYFRSVDHQLNAPQFYGLSKKSDKYDFLITGDFTIVLPEECWLTEQEASKLKKW